MGFMDGYNMTAGNRQLRLQEQDQQFRNNLALAQFSEQQQERIKKEADAGKAAEYFFKANPEGLTAIGETPESFKNKSAGQRYSAMVAYGQAMMAREEAAKRKQLEGLQRFQDATSNFQWPLSAQAVADMYIRSGAPVERFDDVMRGFGNLPGGANQFFSPQDVGTLKPVAGAPGYGIAVTGPNNSQVLFTGAPQGSAVEVPGVGNVGVITTKPGQSTIVPGQQTQGQILEALAKAEADIAKIRTKMKADPEMEKYLGGVLAEQESLANSYRQALGAQAAPANTSQAKRAPQVGEVFGGYRFKGGNPNAKENWERAN